MSSLTTSCKLTLSNYVLRNTAVATVGQLYIALHTGDPGAAGTANEVNIATWTTYSRPAMSFSQIDPGTSISSNSGTVTFPAFVGANQVVTHWSLRDNPAHGAGSGVAYLKGALSAQKELQATDVPTFPPAAMQITWA